MEANRPSLARKWAQGRDGEGKWKYVDSWKNRIITYNEKLQDTKFPHLALMQEEITAPW